MLCTWVVQLNPDAKVSDTTADSVFISGINIVYQSMYICNCVNVSCHRGSDTISTVNGHANNTIRNTLLFEKKRSYVLSDASLPLIICVREDICMFH